MKYKYLTLALLPIFALTLTACTVKDLPLIGSFFGGGKPTGPVTINVWGFWDSPEVMSQLVEKYKETNPNVTINYEDRSVLNLNDYKQAVFTRAQKNDLPDIIRVHNSWVPGLKDYLSSMPSTLMTVDSYKANFYPVATSYGVLDDKVYAIPRYYDGIVLVYNKNHFSEIDQVEAPIAWEEFRRLASELTIRSGNELVRAGAAVGTSKNIDMFSDILGMMFEQAFAGTTDVNESIPNDLNTRPAQDALMFYANFLKEDKVWSEDFPEATTAFVDGRVSMIFIPAWKLLDVLNAQDRINFEIGVAPVPQALPDTPVSWGSFWMDVVPLSSKNSETAWDFLNFLAAEGQQLSNFSETSKYRYFGAPYSLVTLAPQLDSNAYLKPIVATAPFAKSGVISARSGNRKHVEALGKAVQAVLEGTSPDEALATAKEEMLK